MAFRDTDARVVDTLHTDPASGQEQVIVQEGVFDVVMFLEDLTGICLPGGARDRRTCQCHR